MRREDLNRDLTNKRCALFGIIRYLASSPSLLECHYWFWCVSVSVRSLSPFLWHGFWVGCNLYLIFKRTKMSNAIFRGKVLWYWGQQKRRMNLMQILIALIGVCAAAMLLWYVYILMKGDDQAWALWFSMFYKQLMNQYDDEQAELEAKISVCYILICWQAESYMNTLPKLILRLVIWRNIW